MSEHIFTRWQCVETPALMGYTSYKKEEAKQCYYMSIKIKWSLLSINPTCSYIQVVSLTLWWFIFNKNNHISQTCRCFFASTSGIHTLVPSQISSSCLAAVVKAWAPVPGERHGEAPGGCSLVWRGPSRDFIQKEPAGFDLHSCRVCPAQGQGSDVIALSIKHLQTASVHITAIHEPPAATHTDTHRHTQTNTWATRTAGLGVWMTLFSRSLLPPPRLKLFLLEEPTTLFVCLVPWLAPCMPDTEMFIVREELGGSKTVC